MQYSLEGKRVLVTGGTGSIGKALVRELLNAELYGELKSLWVFSRDETKQHAMREEFGHVGIHYLLGDIRNPDSVSDALLHVDVVFHVAALKHVPACEDNPVEAIQTNVLGVNNIVQAIRLHRYPVETLIGVSTDKACQPCSIMGMTKAIQEKILVQANGAHFPRTIVCRFGNVAGSRGSVIPLFRKQAAEGKALTITHPSMTRFLMTEQQAARLLITAYQNGLPGDIWVPIIPSCFIGHLASMYSDNVTYTSIRPGERMNEVIVDFEESTRVDRNTDGHLIIRLTGKQEGLSGQIRSNDARIILGKEELRAFLQGANLL